MPYGFYLTDKGAEMIATNLDKERVVITKACFGSGGDPNLPEFNYAITDLESQFYEKELSLETDTVELVEGTSNQVLIHTVVPDDVSGTISEIGYKDNDDNLILYGLIQKQVKEATEGVTFVYENYVYFENEENQNIEFNIITPEYEKAQELIENAENDLNGIVSGAEENLNGIVNGAEDEFNLSILEIQQILETARQDLDIDSYLAQLAEFEKRIQAMEATLGDSIERLDSAL